MIIAGDPLPPWAVDVESVTLDQLPNRYEDARANVYAGLGKAGDWAYISADDVFIARPVDLIAPAHRGPLTLYRGGGDYYQRCSRIVAWLRSEGLGLLNFEVHHPLLVRTADYLALDELDLPAGFGFSLYGNTRGLKAPRVFDPKITTTGSKPHPSWPVWSTSDRVFSRGYAGKAIRELFRHPGRYEAG